VTGDACILLDALQATGALPSGWRLGIAIRRTISRIAIAAALEFLRRRAAHVTEQHLRGRLPAEAARWARAP
jgi:hypothetical protein